MNSFRGVVKIPPPPRVSVSRAVARAIAVLLWSIASLGVLVGPAGALRCAIPPIGPSDLAAEGQAGAAAWAELEDARLLVGLVVEPTQGASEASAGDRLAIVEPIAGVGIEVLPGRVEIVAGEFAEWGVDPYHRGDYVVVRLAGGADPSTAVAIGPCDWGADQRFTASEAEAVMDSAVEAGLSVVWTDQRPEGGPPWRMWGVAVAAALGVVGVGLRLSARRRITR